MVHSLIAHLIPSYTLYYQLTSTYHTLTPLFSGQRNRATNMNFFQYPLPYQGSSNKQQQLNTMKNQEGIRMSHAPPLLPDRNSSKRTSSAPPEYNSNAKIKLQLNRNNTYNKYNTTKLSDDELTVTNLRKVYSSLLEEIAPQIHELGSCTNNTHSNSNYRDPTNTGVVTVDGDETTGFDYSYTPDTSKKSWRLQRSLPGGGAGSNGITGGDWAVDGIRRYHTGGNIDKQQVVQGNERDGVAPSSNEIMSMGSFDVDLGVMDGVSLSPKKKNKEMDKSNDDVNEDGMPEINLFSIDDGEDEEAKDSSVVEMQDVALDITTSMEDVALDSIPAEETESNTPASISTKQPDNINNDKISSGTFSPSNNMTTFESLYHLSPELAWRLRSAYKPKTSQEQINVELLTQRGSGRRADGIVKGLQVANNCEVRVCNGLRKLSELISYCERLKGARFAVTTSRTFQSGVAVTTSSIVEEEDDLSSEEDDDLEAAESMFAYFCEKNVLPMLIDSLLCHPTSTSTMDGADLSSNTTTIGSSPSPFCGVTWTASVKAQIIQTIAMILFNTSSPLSLAYLLSNNYMNELIMGMLPLDQWKDEALEEILPPYITLLRGLVMRLRGDEGKCCLPLLVCQRESNGNGETYLPLLYAATQVFCHPHGTSLRDSEGCLVRTTAMNVILNLARISDLEVQQLLVGGDATDVSLPNTKSAPYLSSATSHSLTIEQGLLFPHICNSLTTWFHRSTRLVMASLSIDNRNSIKHNDAKIEARRHHKNIAKVLFSELQYWLGFIDDLLSCEIRVWNLRLVELFMREVVVGTILLRWNQSLEVIANQSRDEDTKPSAEEYKARAEIRVAIVFFTQLFGMVEYSPLVRMVAAVLLNNKYPQQWCSSTNIDFGNDNGTGGFFVVTSSINSMIKTGAEESSSVPSADQEADAGAGGGDEKLIPNLHRAALFDMLAGDDAHSSDDTILASMLVATVLENDAIDDEALDLFGILPSPTGNAEGNSPLEISIAKYLSQDWPQVDSDTSSSLSSAIECVSTLGFMLLERLIYHTWTESGQVMDEVPFDHQYRNSKLIQALNKALAYFATQAQSYLDDESIYGICSDLIKQRWRESPDSPRSNDGGTKLTCSLQSYYPSNHINSASVLAGDVYVSTLCNKTSQPSSDLLLFNHDSEGIKLSLQASLHLRSLLGCIEDLHKRITLPHSCINSRFHGEGDALSFRTIEEADDMLLSLGGIQAEASPEVGMEIDVRGRKFFVCSLPNKTKKNFDIVIDTDGAKIVVTEREDLVFVVDPHEIYLGKVKKDTRNKCRCQVLVVVPIQSIIACATEGHIFHIVASEPPQSSSILKDGRLSLKFHRSGITSQSVKECVDKHCTAYEKKIVRDMTDLLEKCINVMEETDFNTSAPSDFKHAN